MAKQLYVVGFLFSKDKKQVLLIRKNRPVWQKGRLNGIGGHVENNEAVDRAMIRETKEETGIALHHNKIEKVVIYTGVEFEVHFYRVFDCALGLAKKLTDESLELLAVTELHRVDCIYNMRWIVPLCLDPNVDVPVCVKETIIYGE